MYGMTGLYGDLFGEVARLQDNLDQLFRPSGMTSIRAMPRRTFPVINVGSTADAFEVLALAPGVDPNTLQITVEKGVLVLAGERKTVVPQGDDVSTYAQERFNGTFRRVISLPDDVDAGRAEANYRDGMLRVKMARSEASRPRRIEIN
jgi:HSP20 family protein